ncbi:MAG: DUF2834 domain-containing protein [Chloroflexota bacterium]
MNTLNSSTTRQILYLITAVAGAVGTWYFNLQATDSFFNQMFANPVSASLTVDILVVMVAFYIWMIAEIRRWKMTWWWTLIMIPLSFGIAFAFAYPLFLFFRERAMGNS